MKKIEVIIKRGHYSKIKDVLSPFDVLVIDKQNLDDSQIFHNLNMKDVDPAAKPVPLAKIEIVISDKSAKTVMGLISKNSGLPSNQKRQMFVSDVAEVLDMDTLEARQDLEITRYKKSETKQLPKRSRFIPLQKFTLHKLQVIYEENKKTLKTECRIKSFSDFANYCIMKSLPNLEKQLRNPTIMYENNSNVF